MRVIILAIVLLTAQNAFSCDLEFNVLKICGNIEFAAQPKVNVDSPFVLSFKKSLSNGSLQPTYPSQQVEVELWMPGMGHGSKPVKLMYFPNTGVIAVSSVYFIMGGDWQIKARLVDTVNGVKQTVDAAEFEISI